MARQRDRHRRARGTHRCPARCRGLRDRPRLQRPRARLRGRGAHRPAGAAESSSSPCRCRVTSPGHVAARARRAARPGRGGAARALASRGCEREAHRPEAVDDDPPARYGRRARQLGRAHRHDHPRCDPTRYGPGSGVRDPTQPRAGAARQEAEAVEGAAERALRAFRRRRGGGERAQAGGLEPPRAPRRLLRPREPARLRRSRRRPGRGRDRGEGAASRRGDEARLGRAEADDRRRPGPHVSLLRPGSPRLRALAQGLERLHAHGAAALLPERDGGPARPRPGPPELRLARKDDRDERAHRHPAEPTPDARHARRRDRAEGDGDGDVRPRVLLRSPQAGPATRCRTCTGSRPPSARRS